MKTTTFRAIALAVATVSACSDAGSGPDLSPTEQRLLDRNVALVAADQASQDVEIMGGPTGSFGFGFAASAAGTDSNQPFRCGTHQRDGLTIVRTCTFKDANGATQAAYDSLTTASAVIHAEIDGTISRNNWEATVSRVRDLTVTGLAGTETQRTWNGTGSGTAQRSRHTNSGETRQYDITGNSTITDVVVALPRTENRWPISGTITHQATIKITGGPRDGQTVTRTVTITFNGTQSVAVKVNDDSFTFDLKNRTLAGDN